LHPQLVRLVTTLAAAFSTPWCRRKGFFTPEVLPVEAPRRNPSSRPSSGSVEQHKLAEQIEADRYLASKEAAKKPNRGLRFNKLVPPGAD
jgi:hypothetical protein